MVQLCFWKFSHKETSKRKLRFPAHQLSWVSEQVFDFSKCASSATEAAKETKFWHKGILRDNDARTSNTRLAQRKRAMPHSTMKTHRNISPMMYVAVKVVWDMTSVLVMTFCNQPEAFASDLGDHQSRYLCSSRLYLIEIEFYIFRKWDTPS